MSVRVIEFGAVLTATSVVFLTGSFVFYNWPACEACGKKEKLFTFQPDGSKKKFKLCHCCLCTACE